MTQREPTAGGQRATMRQAGDHGPWSAGSAGSGGNGRALLASWSKEALTATMQAAERAAARVASFQR